MRLINQYLKILNEQSRFTGLRDDITFPEFEGEDVVPQEIGTTETIERSGEVLAVVDIPTLKESLISLSNGYNTGESTTMMIFGDPGMGKSAIVRATSRDICDRYNKIDGTQRQYIDYLDIVGDESKLQDILDNPENYYVFITINVVSLKPYDIRGIPLAPNEAKEGKDVLALVAADAPSGAEGTVKKKLVDTKRPPVMRTGLEPWMALLNQPDLAGFLFLDELNQAPVSTQTGLYGLLNFGERRLSDSVKISNKSRWGVHAAGNLPEDGLGVVRFLDAFKARMSRCWLEVDYKTWKEWASSPAAMKGNRPLIHPLVLAFLDFANQTFKKDKFKSYFNAPSKKEKGYKGATPNPRQFEMLSDTIAAYLSALAEKVNSVKEQLQNPNLAPEVRADLEQKRRKLLATQNQEVMKAVHVTMNVDWAKLFEQFLKTKRSDIMDLLMGIYKDKEFIYKALDAFSPGKVGTNVKGTSLKQIALNVSIAGDRIRKMLDLLLTEAGVVKNNHINPDYMNNPDQYLQKLRADEEFKKDFYNTLYGIYHIIGALREEAPDIAAIIFSYYKHYEISGQNVFSFILSLVQPSAGILTKEQAKSLAEGKHKSIDIFSDAEIARAKENFQDAVENEDSKAPEEEAEDFAQPGETDQLRNIGNIVSQATNQLGQLAQSLGIPA